MLGAYVVDLDEGPINFSVVMGEESAGRGPRPVHVLFRSTQTVARSRNPARIVHALLSHIDNVLHLPQDGLLAVRAVPLLAGNRAVLAPGRLASDVKSLQPLLRRTGLRMVDVPYATVDPDTAELVVPSPSFDIPEAAWTRLADLSRSTRADDLPVAPGRYPLAGWAFLAGDPKGPMPAERGRLWAYPTVIDGARGGVRHTLGKLDRLLARITAVSTPSAPSGMARAWADLAGTS